MTRDISLHSRLQAPGLEACLDDFVNNPAVHELAARRSYERARTYNPVTGEVTDIGGRARRTPMGFSVELDWRRLEEAYREGAQYNYHYHPSDGERIEERLARSFSPVLESLRGAERAAFARRLSAAARELDRFGRHTPSPQDIEAMVMQEAAYWSFHEAGAPRYGIVADEDDRVVVVEYGPTPALREEISRLARARDELGIRRLGRRVAQQYAFALVSYVEAARASGELPLSELFRAAELPVEVAAHVRPVTCPRAGGEASYTGARQRAA